MNLLIVIISLLVIILLLAGYYFASRVIYPHRFSHQQTHQYEVEEGHFLESAWSSLPKEEVKISSPYGYELFGIYIPSPGSHKTIVIAHGITINLYGSIKYLGMFRTLGFNVMLFDERHHGKSGGQNTTFGYYEKYDLRAVVDWALKRQGGGGTVGVHGESMGAAIALQYAAIDERVAFVIADCSFDDLIGQLKYRMAEDFHLPSAPFLQLADFFSTLITGMSFAFVSPLRDAPLISAPTLFIHGDADKYIPAAMTKRLYDAKTQGIRQLFLAPGADHAKSILVQRAEYERVVTLFLDRLGMSEE